MITTAERRLARLQRRQFGVFARRQASAIGVPVTLVDGRVRSGRYRRLLPGVYAELASPPSWEQRALAAVLWVGGDAVLARSSAARVHGLIEAEVGDGDLHVLVSVRRRADQDGIVVHRSGTISPHDVTTVGPFPVTAVARTVVDLAMELHADALRDVVATAVRGRPRAAGDLRAAAASAGRIAGMAALRRILDELSPLDASCRSPLETAHLRLARSWGIVPTALNARIVDAEGRPWVLDAVHLPERVPIELDSLRYHGSTLDRNDDAERDVRVAASPAGWHETLRFGWGDVHETPDLVARVVTARLEAARSGTCHCSACRA